MHHYVGFRKSGHILVMLENINPSSKVKVITVSLDNWYNFTGQIYFTCCNMLHARIVFAYLTVSFDKTF